MALRTVSNTGGNWNATTTWVGGVVPVSSDTVDFTVLSGPLVVNVATDILAGIDFTNYVNTITFNNLIQLNGSLNLGTGGYTQDGASGLWLLGNTSISGTTVWTRTFTVSTNAAVTLTLSNNLNLTDLSLNGNSGSLSFILGGNVVSISNNISFLGNGSFTLNIPHDLQITNLIIGTGSGNRSCTINGLFTLSISGNLTQSQGISTTSGTTSILLNGTGTWSNNSTGALRNNLTIDTAGIITVSGNVYYNTGTLTYIQGEVITTGSTLNITQTSTLDTSGMTWNNVTITTGTQTLISDLNCQNLTSGGGGSNTINGLFNVNVGGNLTATGIILIGTATIVLIGTGLWTATNGSNTFRIPIIINTNGIITLANTLECGGNLTYIKGVVKSNNTTISFATSTLVNLHKLVFKNVIISAGVTITMNEFFSGSPSVVTNINTSNINLNYTITFQDGFEKIAKFANISGCTLSKPLQLLVTTNSPKNSTNRGIRYINQIPNGIAKGMHSINDTMTFGAAGLLSDPNMR
jgi:hypothetical protein